MSVSSFDDFHSKLAGKLHRQKRGPLQHRGLFMTGVEAEEEAFEASQELVYQIVREYLHDHPTEDPAICDFGAGAGESVRSLGRRFPQVRFTAVMNSVIEHRIAEEALLTPEHLPLRRRTELICGDYTRVAFHKHFHIIFSIESFIHSPKPELFLRNAAAHLQQGGRLILIDDFLAQTPANPALKAKLDSYRKHHLASSLATIEDVKRKANEYGLKLEKTRDLTPYLKNWGAAGKVRHILAPWLRFLAIKNPLVSAILSQDDLRALLEGGVIHYRLLVFQKV